MLWNKFLWTDKAYGFGDKSSGTPGSRLKLILKVGGSSTPEHSDSPGPSMSLINVPIDGEDSQHSQNSQQSSLSVSYSHIKKAKKKEKKKKKDKKHKHHHKVWKWNILSINIFHWHSFLRRIF